MERLSVVVVGVLLLLFLSLATSKFGFCDANPNVICKEPEREALLGFKRGIVHHSNRLSSWVGEDCCTWEGVGCDNITGQVVKLNIGGAGFYGSIPHELGNLSNLHYLDISYNDFLINNIEWISHLSSLELVDMSGVNLSSASNWLQVMNMLPFLSELRLSGCGLGNIDPLPHVNFSSLAVLDLSSNQFISSTFDYFPSLKSLVKLDLHGSFSGDSIPIALQNISTTLRFLDLSDCHLNSTIFDWLYDKTSLQWLDLSLNEFHGKLASGIGNLTSLEVLDLSQSQDNTNSGLEGEIPRSLGNLCGLQRLDLSNNRFSGGISGFLGRSSACIVKSLKYTDLRWNQLSGHLPDNLGRCTSLSFLNIEFNSFSGPIPMSVGRLSSLTDLDISDNQLNGTIPESFGQLSKLEMLDISNNYLEGVVSEVHLANLTGLRSFSASSNLLTLQVSPNWIPPFKLVKLQMRSWQLGPRFPAWLPTQKEIYHLDLSNARISDVIPRLWSPRRFDYLNLSHNHLHGNIPTLFLGAYIYLGSNNFTGPLPHISSDVYELDLSNNSFNGSLTHVLCGHTDGESGLTFLDLSGNLLSGELPDCWLNWLSLEQLRLGNNNLSGNIPSSMGSLADLNSLQLRNNALSGNLPPSLKNCHSLLFVDLSENEFSGSIPLWMGRSLFDLRVLILRSNKFSGSIPLQLCYLNYLWVLDLAENNLSGTIPRCFNNFSAMAEQWKSFNHSFDAPIIMSNIRNEAMLAMKGNEYEYTNNLLLINIINLSHNNLSGKIPEKLTSLHGLISLNLSQNHLRGKIPEKIGAMASLESLDLSMNQLSGVIPQTLANLSFLSYLNLSDNNLSGRIPKGTQIQSFSALSFIRNRELCGPPLKDNCIGDDAPPVPIPANASDEDEEDEGWIDMKWFYMSIPLGFVVGFWGVLGPLAFNKAWRYAYFQFFDGMIHKLWNIVCKCK